MIQISIVIISWNGKQLLDNCLRCLSPMLVARKDMEVVVVDNGSTDQTAQLIAQEYPEVHFRKLSKNFGVSYARNRGIEQTIGKYILILDNDTLPTREAIEGMEQYMEEHTDCGLCACQLTDRDGTRQGNCKRYPGVSEKVANIWHSGEYRYAYRANMNEAFEPEYLIGACQFIRRQAFEEAGCLDESIFYGPEDADFCLRVKSSGWKLCYLPQYSIVHHCMRATNKRLFTRLAWLHVKGLLHFYWKHKRFF